jgi:glycosyltransferase involved in cell wall biosynthesis
MATRNNSNYLEEAVKGVLSQTYQFLELLIINDASTDSTRDELIKYQKLDSRIKIINNTKQLGLTKSLNIGLSKAAGDYIARIDGDDIWTDHHKLQKQLDFLQANPDYGVVGCWSTTIDPQGRPLSRLQYPVDNKGIKNYLLIENCFVHSSVLFRTDLIRDRMGYNPKYQYAQDYDLWLEIGVKTKLHNLPEYMVSYRKNPSGLSRKNYKKQILETINIIKNHSNSYPHALISLILWHIRLFIPDRVRELISFLFRSSLIRQSLN